MADSFLFTVTILLNGVLSRNKKTNYCIIGFKQKKETGQRPVSPMRTIFLNKNYSTTITQYFETLQNSSASVILTLSTWFPAM
jgi:hypothetical protein